jgi:hypothetical protein
VWIRWPRKIEVGVLTNTVIITRLDLSIQTGWKKPVGEKLYDAGDWYASDRLNNTARWRSANLYNLE